MKFIPLSNTHTENIRQVSPIALGDVNGNGKGQGERHVKAKRERVKVVESESERWQRQLKETEKFKNMPLLKCPYPDCDFRNVWPETIEHHKKHGHKSSIAAEEEKLNPGGGA